MIDADRNTGKENKIRQSPVKNLNHNFKDMVAKTTEEEATANNSDEEVDYRIYGVLWENYIKAEIKAKQALADYYQISIDKLVFAQSKEKPENYKNIFLNTSNIKRKGSTRFITNEIEKNKLIFDCYITTSKTIIDMKLSTVNAIHLKDIAYAYYFPDHQLHFFFFLPVECTDSINKLFRKKISELVKKFNSCLLPLVKRLEVKDVQERVKLITRSDLPNFPLLTESLTILEGYLPQPPYLCQKCDKHEEFASFNGLIQHIKRVHLEIKQKCDECEKEVPYGTLSDHKKKEHLKLKERCDECGKDDIPYGQLSTHKKIEHLKIKEKCDECGKNDIPYGRLTDHKKIEHLKIKEKCDECGKDDIPYGKLSDHKKHNHSKVKETCDECGRDDIPYGKLSDHKKRNHSKVKETCDECGREDIPYGKLSDHKKRDHLQLKETCDKCGKEVIYGTLSTHKKTNHLKPKQKCDDCGEEVPYGKLHIHKKTKHQKIKQRCDDCGEEVYYGTLSKHKKRKHLKITQQCEQCHELVPYGDLSTHKIRKHNNSK